MRHGLPRLALLSVVLLAALPHTAFACAMCIGASDRNAVAYAATAVFLSAVPLGSVFGFMAWLKRRARRLDEQGPGTSDSPR